jgi:hypothetical protein
MLKKKLNGYEKQKEDREREFSEKDKIIAK